MDTPIRVLHRVGSLGNAGLEAVVMNYYRHIDKSKVQFDFIVEGTEKQRYDDEILQNGGKVYRIKYNRLLNPIFYLREVSKIIKAHEYDIVHLHTNSASIVMEALVAKWHKVTYVIGHSHNSSCKFKLQHYLFKPFLCGLLFDRFACSKLAAGWLYGEKSATICNNAIQTSNFAFNSETRTSMRKEFALEDKFVLGHIGRFEKQKNHGYLVDVFNKVKKTRADAVLVLIGEGSLKENIKNKVAELSLSDSVLFLGNRSDVNKFYQMFDVFIFPSLFEGLGVVAIEAQAAGLKCFVSQEVPEEAKVTELIEFLDINLPPQVWAKKILEHGREERERPNMLEEIRKNRYDIETQAKWLENYYLKLSKEGVNK